MWTWVLIAILIILVIIIGIVEYYGSITAAWTALTHRAHATTGGAAAHHISVPGVIGSIIVAGLLLWLLTTNPSGLFGEFGNWCKAHSRIIILILLVGLTAALYHFSHHSVVVKWFGIVFCLVFAAAMFSSWLDERKNDPERIAKEAEQTKEERNISRQATRELTNEEKFTIEWYKGPITASIYDAQDFMEFKKEVMVMPGGFTILPEKASWYDVFYFEPNGSPVVDLVSCDVNGVEKPKPMPSLYYKETYAKNVGNRPLVVHIYHWKIQRQPNTTGYLAYK